METVRLTMAQALVRYLCNQYTELDGREVPLFAGIFAIFGHGNVTCLAEALEAVRTSLPTWRGQNEQSMALAAIGYAKRMRRRRIMAATSSIGPGATNMVTAAALAHANRLPVLLLAGDVFSNRRPDPVLQQVEHFGNPTTSVNDAFRSVTRYWDRITHPEQILESLPQALAVMLDPADCGPAFLGLCQDTQEIACDYPAVFFEPRLHRIPRPRPDRRALADAAALLRAARRPLILAGGGVRYSLAERELADFAARFGVPVAETVAGRGVLVHQHPCNVGPVGVIGSASANALAGEADVVLAIGTRLQDFTTGSWSVFDPDARFIGLNAARFDAHKHRGLALVADALEGLQELSVALEDWRADPTWGERGRTEYATWNVYIDDCARAGNITPPSYAQVVGAVSRAAGPTDLALTAAGGLPGELCKGWRVRIPGSFDCEFGYSCMGYEIAGAWGASMASADLEAEPGEQPGDIISLCGDGSYLMMNSDIYSSVLTGHKFILVVCDNRGFAIINRLQNFKGGASFNNLLADCRIQSALAVDFAKHAESMGAHARSVTGIVELEEALRWAKTTDRTTVISIETDAHTWTAGDAWWDVGVPEISDRDEVVAARDEHMAGRLRQRRGV